jgi:hypothetical protein
MSLTLFRPILFVSLLLIPLCPEILAAQTENQVSVDLSADSVIAKAINQWAPLPEGHRLRHPAYTVDFRPDEIAVHPGNSGPSWVWQLSKLGEEPHISTESCPPELTKQGILQYRRGSIVERYIPKQRSVEQVFILEKPLELGGIDLVIEGSVQSDGRLEETANGWRWRDDFGSVTLGDVYVFDADGHELKASMTVTAERTRIEVNAHDLAAARYPVTIDPEIGADDFRISEMGTTNNTLYGAFEAATVYNPTANEFLVVWRADDNTGALANDEFEIYGQRIDADTGSTLGSRIRISDMGVEGSGSYDALGCAVAYNATDDEYLVVWEADDNNLPLTNDEYEIFGQLLDGSGAEIGANDFRISDMGPNGNTAYDAYNPDVAYNVTENAYLVVWHGDDDTAPLVNEEFEIFGQRLDASGAELGADFRISDMGDDAEASASVRDNFVASTPAVAFNATDNEYLVVWFGDDDTAPLVDNENEIFGQRIDGATGAELGSDLRLSDM